MLNFLQNPGADTRVKLVGGGGKFSLCQLVHFRALGDAKGQRPSCNLEISMLKVDSVVAVYEKHEEADEALGSSARRNQHENPFDRCQRYPPE